MEGRRRAFHQTTDCHHQMVYKVVQQLRAEQDFVEQKMELYLAREL